MKHCFAWTHSFESARIQWLALMGMAILLFACTWLGAPSAAFAAVEDAVGQTFTVTDASNGSLEFTIRKAAEDGVGEVSLKNGKSWTGEALTLDSVEVDVDGQKKSYGIVAIENNAFQSNKSIRSVSITYDLTGVLDKNGAATVAGVGNYAFEGCTSLREVHLPQKINGIGESAFAACSRLTTVDFPIDAVIYITSIGLASAIQRNAFGSCGSLKEIAIPAITSATRKNDYYTQYRDGNTDADYFLSGYEPYWHDGYAPVWQAGISHDAFKGCTELRTVVFRAGNPIGCFAYLSKPGNGIEVFSGCTKLQNISFEAEQPYYYNPNKAMWNAAYNEPWDFKDTNTGELQRTSGKPDYYYGITYYVTENDAIADDDFGSNRLARVDYKSGTSASSIAAGDASALSSNLLSKSLYAQDGTADGNVPDPNAEAAKAGLDTSKKWVWHLDSTQSRRSGLSESCKAWLVPAAGINFGHIESAQTDALYQLCDRNFSQNPFNDESVFEGQDVAFDPIRFYRVGTKVFPQLVSDTYRFENIATTEVPDAWFSLTQSTKVSFYDKIKVFAADGTELSWDDCDASFQKYNKDTNAFEDVTLGDEFEGPLLMTVTPQEQSGYDGVLKEWVFVRGHAGTVAKLFTDRAEQSFDAAAHAGGLNSPIHTSDFTSPYAVGVGTKDTSSMLVAAGIAGVARAPLSSRNTTTVTHGFELCGSYLKNGAFNSASADRFPSSDGAAAEFAVASYRTFDERERAKFGATADQYPWGSEAVLVPVSHLEEAFCAAAAYAYAAKAPVFYINEDGSVSDSTLSCLKDFSTVVVIGDESMFGSKELESLQTTLGSKARIGTPAVKRISSGDGASDTAGTLSLAAAHVLIESGIIKDPSQLAIVDVREPADAAAALNMIGPNEGILLCTTGTADSKKIAAFLAENKDTLDTVRFFGRDSSIMSGNGFDAYDHAGNIWNADYAAPDVSSGDTFALRGNQVAIGSDGASITPNGVKFGSGSLLPKGSYVFAGKPYVLAEDAGDSSNPGTGQGTGTKPDPSPDPKPGSQLELGNILMTSPAPSPSAKPNTKPQTPSKQPNSGAQQTPNSQGGQQQTQQGSQQQTSGGSQQTSSPAQLTVGNLRSSDTPSNAPTGGSLSLQLDGSEEDEAPAGEDTLVLEGSEEDSMSFDNPDSLGMPGDEITSNNSGGTPIPPLAVGGILIGILAVTGLAIWFATRRGRSGSEEAFL